MLETFDVQQGSTEWDDLRRGIITASTVGRFITPKTVKPAENVESRAMTAQLVAERITGFTIDSYASGGMERGHHDEPIARDLYREHYSPVVEVGFMVKSEGNFRIGLSPDGLVGDEGLIEIKSREPKAQLATVLADAVPPENVAQLQAALFVSGRKWIDYVSFCGGMAFWKKRVLPDPRWQDAIISVLESFEAWAEALTETYLTATAGLPETERTFTDVEEMRI